MHESSAHATALATGLFRQAAAAGRDALNDAELDTLLPALGLTLRRDAVAPVSPVAVDLRISLNHTWEFGMVISAGMGGLDADPDESNFKQDRTSASCAIAPAAPRLWYATSKRACMPTRCRVATET